MAQDNDMAQLRRSKVQRGWLTRNDRRGKGWSSPWPSPREQERENTLVDFVGEERASSVFADLRPAFQNAGQLASSIVGKLDLEENAILDEISRNWTFIMGADNASQCRPLKVDNGALTIEVFSSSWLFVLNGHRPLISRRVTELTSGAVKRIHFVQQGTTRRS